MLKLNGHSENNVSGNTGHLCDVVLVTSFLWCLFYDVQILLMIRTKSGKVLPNFRFALKGRIDHIGVPQTQIKTNHPVWSAVRSKWFSVTLVRVSTSSNVIHVLSIQDWKALRIICFSWVPWKQNGVTSESGTYFYL